MGGGVRAEEARTWPTILSVTWYIETRPTGAETETEVANVSVKVRGVRLGESNDGQSSYRVESDPSFPDPSDPLNQVLRQTANNNSLLVTLNKRCRHTLKSTC